MAYPCTIILLNMNMDTYLTFKYFCNLILAKEFTMNIFQFKMDMIKVYTKTFEEFLKVKNPNIYKHLKDLNV